MIAILTILGYSLYDTIVVYDKVKENADKPAVAQKMTYTDMMSLSLNQVLMRSLNTTITSLLPVLAMLIVGLVHPRRGHAPGVRRRPHHRPHRRRLLVDLRRHAAGGVPQGA